MIEKVTRYTGKDGAVFKTREEAENSFLFLPLFDILTKRGHTEVVFEELIDNIVRDRHSIIRILTTG